MEQETGVEPAFQAWEARVLPMYYSCIPAAYGLRIDIFYYEMAFCQVFRDARKVFRDVSKALRSARTVRPSAASRPALAAGLVTPCEQVFA